MKTWMLWMAVLVTLSVTVFMATGGLGGCEGVSNQQIIDAGKAGIPMLQQLSADFGKSIEETQAWIAETQKRLADPNLPPDVAKKYQDGLTTAHAKLARLQEQMAQADKALAELKKIVDSGPSSDAQLADTLQMLGQSLVAGSTFISGPAKVWMGIAGSLLLAIAAALGKKAKATIATLNTDLTDYKTGLGQVVMGGERFKTDVRYAMQKAEEASAAGKSPRDKVDPVAIWKAAMDNTQRQKTQELVAQLRVSA